MKMPQKDDALTQSQIESAFNFKQQFSSATPGTKSWHYGQFEPWAPNFGYQDGIPIYADVLVNDESIHIYYLNDAHKCPIILRPLETPATYGVKPE